MNIFDRQPEHRTIILNVRFSPTERAALDALKVHYKLDSAAAVVALGLSRLHEEMLAGQTAAAEQPAARRRAARRTREQLTEAAAPAAQTAPKAKAKRKAKQ